MSKEIRREGTSEIRRIMDPSDKLPEVAFVPSPNSNQYSNADNFTLIDISHGGYGEATFVRTPAGERYLTRLAISDAFIDAEVRMAAYVLAAEDTTLRCGEPLRTDLLVERLKDVTVWEEFVRRGVAEEIEPFMPLARSGQQDGADLYVGHARILPPQ